MGDNGFLLLKFFLVTTKITKDKGVRVKLPKGSEETTPEMKINSKNTFGFKNND